MNVNEQIEELISSEQYTLSDSDKEKKLLPIFLSQMKSHYDNNEHIKSWFDKIELKVDEIKCLNDIPVLPTQMFKHFDLCTTKEPLQRVLHSSSTTSQTPSKIPISVITARRQSKALLSIMKNFLPNKRMPFLVLDCETSNKQEETITARGAAIRGFSIFARKTVYAFDDVNGQMVLNKERVVDFLKENENKDVLTFGFTYIIWSEFLPQLSDVIFNNSKMKLLHGGGWKKLKHLSVSKEKFSTDVAKVFNTDPSNVLDFYGMVEQTGLVFIDCEQGYKHCPNFADVKIRDFYTLNECEAGKKGFIEIMNILPDSYPGMSIITEDVGEVIGVDDCKCGRKGKYFVFRNRVEKAEVRGCGDTYK
jgi:phenylacetate-coenzyme A ligase PaaK-like adenylate-forming protein